MRLLLNLYNRWPVVMALLRANSYALLTGKDEYVNRIEHNRKGVKGLFRYLADAAYALHQYEESGKAANDLLDELKIKRETD